jgi:hypothetical protein
MKNTKAIPVIEQLVGPLADCLTPESARRLLALKPDPALQARIDDMATRHTEGRVTPEEQAEWALRFLRHVHRHPEIEGAAVAGRAAGYLTFCEIR